ncbi:MAG TPA: hypothetical protein VGF29_03895, partial [Hyphomicrobiaceae bacterium]
RCPCPPLGLQSGTGACGRLTPPAVVCLARVRRLRAAIAPDSAPTRLAKYRAVTHTSYAERKTMDSPNVYRVRFIQSQRYAINISAPSPELAEFFAEEIRKRAGAAPFEAIGEAFSGDWQSEQICSANPPDLLAAIANALEQLRRGGPRWTIEESLANALARAKAQGSAS